MRYLLERLGEPSTYAGIGIALCAAGVAVPAGYLHDAALIGMVASGVAAVVVKEGWRRAIASGDAASAAETAVINASKG